MRRAAEVAALMALVPLLVGFSALEKRDPEIEAGNAALKAGRPGQAEQLRQELLKQNPYHALKPFPTFVEAARAGRRCGRPRLRYWRKRPLRSVSFRAVPADIIIVPIARVERWPAAWRCRRAPAWEWTSMKG